MNNPNDGGPVSRDLKSKSVSMTICEKFTLFLEVLPSFLIQTMPELPAMNGGWEQTVMFTAGAQELRGLTAYCIASSQEPRMVKKFTVGITINWTTEDGTSKEQRHQTTKNTTTLGRWLKERGHQDTTRLVESVYSAGMISFHIQTIEDARKDALYCGQSPSGLDGPNLRDWFAGQAIDMASHDLTDPSLVAQRVYAVADAMLAARTKFHQTKTP